MWSSKFFRNLTNYELEEEIKKFSLRPIESETYDKNYMGKTLIELYKEELERRNG